MKKLIQSNFTNAGTSFPVKSGTLDFIQLAYQECIQAIILATTQDGYIIGNVLILYGCVQTNLGSTSNFSGGAIYYNGFVYLVPEQGGVTNPISGQVFVCNISTSYYTTIENPAGADPVTFYTPSSPGSVVENVHRIETIQFVAGDTGTGTLSGDSNSDFNNLIPYLTASGFNALVENIGAINNTLDIYNIHTTIPVWTDFTDFSGTWTNYAFPYELRYTSISLIAIYNGKVVAGGTDTIMGVTPLIPSHNVSKTCILSRSGTDYFVEVIVFSGTGQIELLSMAPELDDILSLDGLSGYAIAI